MPNSNARPGGRPNAYPMIFQLFASRPTNSNIDALYGAIVAQARLPGFYLTYGVPDTVEGRFDMIVLHLVLLFHRLGREPEAVRGLVQGVFDRFCRDMDHNLREMGVGDLSVPKEMRRLGEAFYGRAGGYERAIAGCDADCGQLLTAALARNVFAEESSSSQAGRLAAYVIEAVRQLDAIEGTTIACGRLSFPDPEAVPAAAYAD
jgi:cytochrome b pre-mRNA-processing protein 3